MWEKKPALTAGGFQSNCLNGGLQPLYLPLDTEIGVGFGSCTVMKGDECIYQEAPGANEEAPRLQKFEDLAKADPNHDWQVHFLGAMSEETYQRQGDSLWALIEKRMGFA